MTTPSKMVMKIFVLFVLLCGLNNSTFAAITVTPATNGTTICSTTASVTPTTLGPITVTEGLNADLGNNAGGWNVFITVTAPTGWQFFTTSAPTYAFTATRNITGVTQFSFTATVLTIQVAGNNRNALDAFTITGLKVLATTGASGNIVAGVGFGTATGIAGQNMASLALITPPGSIVGNAPICTSSALQLSDAVSGGTWTSATTTVAAIGTGSGLVSSGIQGNAVITYSNGCGPAAQTTVTVNMAPSGITGSLAVCSGSTSTLSDAAANGTWSSTNTAIATMGLTSGVLTAGIAGVVTINYSNNCGTDGSSAMITGTVTPVTGPSSVCVTSSITLSESAAGGTWSSDNTTDATVDAFGNVTGQLAGGANITYNNGCGSSTVPITVNAPDAGTISGPTNVCVGSNITLLDAVSGGAWSSSNTNAATVDASGHVFGAGTGPTTISYVAAANSCGPGTATYIVNSSVPATAGAIVGSTTMCAGSFQIVTDAAPSGVWSVSNTNASISNTGLLTAITPGVDIVSYTVTNACGPISATLTVTIFPVLNAGTITGPNTLCPNTNVTLSDNVPGGVWSSTNTTVATISGVGVVTGLSAGSTTISYLMISGCGSVAALYNITVNPSPAPGSISGPSVICTGTFAVLSDAATGGVWSSSNTNLATVDGFGTVTAVNVGTANIAYTVTNSCGTLAANHLMSFSLSPNPGTIFGPPAVCVGAQITLNDLATGVWSSGNTSASVSPSGVVTGLAAGIGIISYTATTACASSSTTMLITVNPQPVAGSISGLSAVCVGSTIALTDAATGGVWSSSNTGFATVDASGNVWGASPGSATINYSVTNVCNTAVASQVVTVNPVPVVFLITGPAAVCVGSNIILSDATPGGLWNSSNGNVSIVSGTSGLVVTGVASGSSAISYTVTNGFGCSTTTVIGENINPLPVVANITGADFGCVGLSNVLSDATIGGVWSTDNASLATIDPSNGTLQAIAPGAFNVSYTVTNGFSCVTTVTLADTVKIIPVPTFTTGVLTICVGNTTTLSNAATGGIWSSANGNATVSPSGVVTGVAGGTDYIIYDVSNSCATVMDSSLLTVNALPLVNIITGNNTICAGTTTTLGETTTGGVWNTSNTGVAVVSSTGVVTGITAGSVGISYTVTNSNGCSATTITGVFVGPSIDLTATPADSATLCGGNPVTLQIVATSSPIAYQWMNGSIAIPGATNDSYTFNTAGTFGVTVSNGTCSETFTTIMSLAPNPIISFTAPDVLYTGSFASYQWFLNGVAITGETSSILHETSDGAYTVVVSDGNGCTDTSAVYTMGITTGVNNVNLAQGTRIYPNPATNVLNIDAPVKVNVAIYSVDGKMLISQKDVTSIDVRNLAGGIYMIMIYDEHNILIKTAKFAKGE